VPPALAGPHCDQGQRTVATERAAWRALGRTLLRSTLTAGRVIVVLALVALLAVAVFANR
jgi:hypothetical protein